MADVVVVGGGLAGAWAAAAAARSGAGVTLVRRALGATAVSSGAIDFVPPAEATDPRSWLARLPRDDPLHPYVAGGEPPSLDELAEEAARLTAALAEAGLPHRADLADPALVGAITGQVRSAGVVQETIAAGDLRGKRRLVAVAGIQGLGRLRPELVAAALEERGEGRLRSVPLTVAVPGIDPAIADDLDDATLARAIEAPGGAEALGAALQQALARAAGVSSDVILLPAVLGLEDAAATAARVAAAAGVRVAELLSPPPSAPGWRLAAACERVAGQSGTVMVAASAIGLRTDGRRVVGVETDDGRVLPCDACVLATGKFIGGGLVQDPNQPSGRARLREALLDLPVLVAGSPVDTTTPRDRVRRQRFAEQPFLGAGVRSDGAGRPLDRLGRPAFENVTVCGSLLSGVETTLRGGGLGVVAWTATRAGLTASSLAGAVVA